MERVSVIIPALNEEANLGRLLHELAGQQGVAAEVLVADGGSEDGSEQVCRARGVCFIRAPRGRGAQMNRAALEATHPLLLFLHADSHLPDTGVLAGAIRAFRGRCEARPDRRLAGHFPLRFVRTQPVSGHRFLFRYMEEKSATNRPETINGDQGLLILHAYFDELGGFDDSLGFLEDQRIAHRIFQSGEWLTLPGALHTSARRFEQAGSLRLYLLMAIIMGVYKSGLPGFFERLPRLYPPQRESGPPHLTPCLKLIWALQWHPLTLRESSACWYRAGAFLRANTWQLFFGVDQLLRPLYRGRRFPLLRLYDRWIYPVTHHPLVSLPLNGLAALLLHIGICWVLFAVVWGLERRWAGSGRSG